MKSRQELAMLCIKRLEANGHSLFNCHCGRIHVDPLGIVNPRGWTQKEMVSMYLSAALSAIALVAIVIWATA